MIWPTILKEEEETLLLIDGPAMDDHCSLYHYVPTLLNTPKPELKKEDDKSSLTKETQMNATFHFQIPNSKSGPDWWQKIFDFYCYFDGLKARRTVNDKTYTKIYTTKLIKHRDLQVFKSSSPQWRSMPANAIYNFVFLWMKSYLLVTFYYCLFIKMVNGLLKEHVLRI